ncbi:type VI secretion system protein ImpG [Bosea sp. OK403]|uniref:type VI secretion system baseplate subunit TssF n=1 Tax=Bosea sp. OK403 TaxID=1855286 RepID=UPI0008E4589D|nr:type VI secretion system baseplate subunit TssF [Bosea sp. OK403]SFH93794.1 type VI secretion system protein ImpG [Bosea sp. OK403]
MDREFLDLYNRELDLLYQQAKEFGDEYPGIADRLGGLVRDRIDPMVSGLLEGTAFLAARVQLKLKHEFPEFTSNLLEQLVPNYLAPTPSCILARFQPAFGDTALREGKAIAKGSYIDATYQQRGRRVACRYRLASDVTLWPFEITGAEYFATPAALQGLGIPIDRRALAGLRIGLTHRTTPRRDDEPSDTEAKAKPECWFSGTKLETLPFYLTGAEPDAHALYEHVMARCIGVFLRYLDPFGDPVAVPLPQDCLRQIGMEEEEALLPHDARIFRGFDLLREYFMFPRKFLGFTLGGLKAVRQSLAARNIEIVMVFDEASPRLGSIVDGNTFSLYTSPAVNLFEMGTDRIPMKTNVHEHHVVPDRSRYLEFEPHRIVEVFAHFAGGREKVPVRPLYSSSLESGDESGLFYTIRRLPRRRSIEEKQRGAASDYIGTDMFISLTEKPGTDLAARVVELSIRAFCSNRHLAEQLPVGSSGADFRLPEDQTLDIVCVAGPTAPREPVASYLRSRGETAHTGTVTWRLINMLSLNHLGLLERGGGKDGRALRETLALFADLADAATERRIRGTRSLDSRPVVRRVRHRAGLGAARGTEVTVTLDEKAFEGSGAFLLGAILDRFFAEYAGMNHFTQTVIRTVERGEIARWPPRAGSRRVL